MEALSRKCLLLVVLAAFAVTTSGQHESDSKFQMKFSKDVCHFTVDMLKNVVERYSSSNIIFSPASISILLSVLQQGAKKNTANQLEKVLYLSADESKKGFNKFIHLHNEKNVTLEWGNRCYIKPGIEIQQEFLKSVKKNFDVDVEELNFGVPSSQHSADTINNWIKKITHNHIQNLVEPSMVTRDTLMVLINAIFFKGIWVSPFKKGKTLEQKFEKNLEESVQAFFMSQREKFYADKDSYFGAKWVQLPFENRRFSMVFILPTKRHQLNQLIKKLTGDDLYKIFTNQGISQVKLRIPKFKLSEKVSLVETLLNLGLTDMFSGASDLSGISNSLGNLQVSDIIHQANIEVDEKGSTGSAATVIQLLRMKTPNLTFVADQPFLFFIIDTETYTPLFAGKVVDPKSGS